MQINDETSSAVVAQLLFLQSEDSKKSIHLYINSPGGSVTAGLGIYDTMQFIKPPVATWCLGQACSMGAFLLASGKNGFRHSLPHSRIMIHQPHGYAGVSQKYDSVFYQKAQIQKYTVYIRIKTVLNFCSSKLYNYFVFNFQGQATDIAIQAEEIINTKKTLNLLLSKHTGRPLREIGLFTSALQCPTCTCTLHCFIFYGGKVVPSKKYVLYLSAGAFLS